VTAPFWSGARPYQPSSPHWEPRVIAVTNPIRVDADGDGRFTSAREYAINLMITETEPAQVIAALEPFDEAVAAQAASILRAGGVNTDSALLQSALDRASPATRRGFALFKETQR
jgi:hypothetical protein